MSVVLLITRDVGEHVSGHADDDAALVALLQYVDAHWADAKLPEDAADLDPEKRIDLWIAATQALYMIATPSIEIDLS